MDRLLLSLCLIFLSLAAGHAVQHLLRIPRPLLERVRQRLQSLAVFCLIPCSAMLSLWGLPSPDSRLLVLPFLGIASWIWGGILSLRVARGLHLDGPRTGSFYCCGTFANLGAVGALVSVLFFGEKAIAIVALFRLCEEMFYFGISFPVARRLGGGEGVFSLRSFRPDPVLLLILTALGLGLALNVLGVPRPAPLGSLAAAAMLLATVLFLFAIGLGLRLSRVSCYAREAAALAAACAAWQEDYPARIQEIKEYALESLSAVPRLEIISRGDAPHICAVSLPGYPSEMLVRELSDRGVYVSSGSACHRGKPSHVFAALGLPKRTLMGVLRVSFSPESTRADVDALAGGLTEITKTRIAAR